MVVCISFSFSFASSKHKKIMLNGIFKEGFTRRACGVNTAFSLSDQKMKYTSRESNLSSDWWFTLEVRRRDLIKGYDAKIFLFFACFSNFGSVFVKCLKIHYFSAGYFIVLIDKTITLQLAAPLLVRAFNSK
ncbi:Uncharacterised protein [Bartonella vinsonii]|uniref:Uncharacterized protein n=1 Tax=Bartonella vinsonii TaxID=33047 RepID=A0A3S5F8V9_BARVI|nr:Uncharacterised protein [Bartonella vinsonii]